MISINDTQVIQENCGNYITLNDCKEIVLETLTKDSRVPIPTRLADIETHKLRKEFLSVCNSKK